MTRKNYYFTFGFGHAHPNGYFEFKDMTFSESRSFMCELFGNKWAFQYSEEEFAGQAAKHGLKCHRTLYRLDLPSHLEEREHDDSNTQRD